MAANAYIPSSWHSNHWNSPKFEGTASNAWFTRGTPSRACTRQRRQGVIGDSAWKAARATAVPSRHRRGHLPTQGVALNHITLQASGALPHFRAHGSSAVRTQTPASHPTQCNSLTFMPAPCRHAAHVISFSVRSHSTSCPCVLCMNSRAAAVTAAANPRMVSLEPPGLVPGHLPG